MTPYTYSMLAVVVMIDLLRECTRTYKLKLLVAPKENVATFGRTLLHLGERCVVT